MLGHLPASIPTAPPRGEESFHLKDDGGSAREMPPWRRGRSLSTSVEKNSRCRTLYPPWRTRNATLIEDDGGGSMVVTTMAVRRHVGSQKIIAAGPLTPHGRRGTGLRSRTMGVNDLDIS
jgi:hypothetical protein